MCGIAGVYFNELMEPDAWQGTIENFLDELMLGIEERGRDATGLVAMPIDGDPFLQKADIEASKFIQHRDRIPVGPRAVLLHTRYATQGSPKNLDNNHPVQYQSCYVTHNGHISNDSELFTANALKRMAQVDSEVIPALISKHGFDSAKEALEALVGGFAIAAIDPVNAPDKLLLAKGNSSPLIYVKSRWGMAWASTESALARAFGKVFNIELKKEHFGSFGQGDMMVVTPEGVEESTFKVAPRYSYTSSYSTSNYSRYARVSEEEKKSICKCSHTRYRHGDFDYRGRCWDSSCTCGMFIYDKKASKAARKERRKQAAAEAQNSGQAFYKANVGGGAMVTKYKCPECEMYEIEGNMTLMNDGLLICKECSFRDCELCGKQFYTDELTTVLYKVYTDGSSDETDEITVCDDCEEQWARWFDDDDEKTECGAPACETKEPVFDQGIEVDDAAVAITAVRTNKTPTSVGWFLWTAFDQPPYTDPSGEQVIVTEQEWFKTQREKILGVYNDVLASLKATASLNEREKEPVEEEATA